MLQEVRHLSEERQKQIYALKQQLQNAHQRLDESSSTSSTILRLKEELSTQREVSAGAFTEGRTARDVCGASSAVRPLTPGCVFQAVKTVKTFLATKTKMLSEKNAQIKDMEHQCKMAWRALGLMFRESTSS